MQLLVRVFRLRWYKCFWWNSLYRFLACIDMQFSLRFIWVQAGSAWIHRCLNSGGFSFFKIVFADGGVFMKEMHTFECVLFFEWGLPEPLSLSCGFIAHLFCPWRQWLYSSFNQNELGMGGGRNRGTFLWCFPMGVVILLFLWPPEIVWQWAIRSGAQEAEEVTAVRGSAATVYGNGAERRTGNGSLQRAAEKEANRQRGTSTTSGKRHHTPTSPPSALQGTTGPDVSLER